MLLKVNAWVMVEVMNGQPGIAHFGQVRYTDAAGVCIKTADLETRALTGWEMAIPWHNVKYIFASDAVDLAGFAAALGKARATQSAKTN